MTAHSGAAAHPIPAGLGREQLFELYSYMRLTRSLEERLTAVLRWNALERGQQ